MTTKHRIFTTSFASVYPCYVAKAERKGRNRSEVDAVICCPVMREIRYLDKLVDELAKGRAMDKILRT